MEFFEYPYELPYEKTTVALGNFDGVHLAHQMVINNAKFLALKNVAKSGIVLFIKDNPKDFIYSDKEKIKEIEGFGLDFVYVIKFNEEFMKKTPEEFIIILKEKLKIVGVAVGFDYRFGKNASGDVDILSGFSLKYNFDISICPKQEKDGVKIASTAIRDEVKKGNLAFIKEMTGRDYSIISNVSDGLKNGEKLGFPTANIIPEKERVILPDGVYAGEAIIDNVTYKAVINIGKNPTFESTIRTIEAHIFDFDEDIYDKEIKVIFKSYIRSEKKFNTKDELKEQIKKDIERAKKLYE